MTKHLQVTPDKDTAENVVRFTVPAPGVARVVMDRPKKRNAQNIAMNYQMDAAFQRAVRDDSINVIILAGADPHFSAGHDLSGDGLFPLPDYETIGVWSGFSLPGAEGIYGREKEIYLDICERWRNLSKPVIAEVQGLCAAGGLMLAWVCDIIVASDDASFVDPVINLGVAGVEYFVHPFELGPRKAKELLFTADAISAQEAHRLGMVNHVVARADLSAFTLALAQKISTKPSFALKMTKEAVNAAEDAMGRKQALTTAFALHQLCHAHNKEVVGAIIDPRGLSGSAQAQYMGRLRAELSADQFARVEALVLSAVVGRAE